MGPLVQKHIETLLKDTILNLGSFTSVMLIYKNMKEQSTLKFSTILGVVSSKGKGLEPGRRRKEEGDQGLLAS